MWVNISDEEIIVNEIWKKVSEIPEMFPSSFYESQKISIRVFLSEKVVDVKFYVYYFQGKVYRFL